jgi:hypothetical protein
MGKERPGKKEARGKRQPKLARSKGRDQNKGRGFDSGTEAATWKHRLGSSDLEAPTWKQLLHLLQLLQLLLDHPAPWKKLS